MAEATVCPKCGGLDFELENEQIANSTFSFDFVRCVLCGTPVGVVDDQDVIETLLPLVEAQGEKIESMEKRLKSIETSLHEIARQLEK
jgi:peptide subunit release factor 1 (eRF1)